MEAHKNEIVFAPTWTIGGGALPGCWLEDGTAPEPTAWLEEGI